jgi:hypothetical protein
VFGLAKQIRGERILEIRDVIDLGLDRDGGAGAVIVGLAFQQDGST